MVATAPRLASSQTNIMMSTESANVRVVHTFLDAFRAKDYNALGALFGEGFQAAFFPASMGVPPADAERFMGTLKGLENVTQSGMINIQPIEIIDAAATGQVILHAKSVDTFSKDGKIPFLNEYIYIFTIVDGKIVRMKEFMDTKAVTGFMAATGLA